MTKLEARDLDGTLKISIERKCFIMDDFMIIKVRRHFAC